MPNLGLTRRQALAGAAATGLAGPFWLRARPAFAQGATLRVRANADIERLDPANWGTHSERDVIDSIYAKLVAFKPGSTWEWELQAAESIEQVDPLTVRFKLRPGLMWSNDMGEVTADDVKFSFERIADPAQESSYRDDWAALDQIEVTDTHSGLIRLKTPFAPLWTSTLPWLSGSIVSRKAVEAMGGKIATDPGACSGPYFIAEWQPKQRIVLRRNPGWTISQPAFDEVVLLPIEDENAAEIAYRAGELDYTKVAASSARSLADNLPEGTKMVTKPTLDYIWLGMNVENPKFKDVRVREAVAKAVDVQAVLDGAYFGMASYATGVVGPGLPGHLETAVPPRDVEGAKALLSQTDQASGLSLTLHTLTRSDRMLGAQIIQANLAEIGVIVEIVALEAGQYWALMDTVGLDTEMFIIGYGGAPDPSWGTMWFTPEQVGVWNWERWNSPEFGTLHAKALAETDPAKRADLYGQMGKLMNDSSAYVWLANEPWVAIYRNTIAEASLPNGWVSYSHFAPA